MAEPASQFPFSFAALSDAPPPGLRVSMRLLSPVLVLARGEGGIYARPGGIRTVRGSRHVLVADSIDHDWVRDGSSIRPLPADTPAEVSASLGARAPDGLVLADVLALVAAATSGLPVEVAPELLVPAEVPVSVLPDAIHVPGLQGTPYPYQARGIRWMHGVLARGAGLILADEMGLGKTLQIIGLLLLDPPANERPVLIVCPGTLLANWEREIARFAPSIDARVHHGALRPGTAAGLTTCPLVLTTYDTLVSDRPIFAGVPWHLVVCDEAQAVRNPDTARRRALDGLERRACIPVTGTPVENTLLDLWSLVDLALPGLLGNRERFEDRYPDGSDAASMLAGLTAPVVLRRRVADVAQDLPERIDIDVPLDFGSALAAGYRRIRRETLAEYGAAGPLVATGRLSLFCAHPRLVPPTAGANTSEFEDAALDGRDHVEGASAVPKLERAAELVLEAFGNGQKVLVFAVFNRCAELLFERIGPVSGLLSGTINGGTPSGERQGIVDRFSAHPGPALLVLNPRAAGTGLNITAATVVIHYTPVWNPALESQASARAYRRGQERPVTVYRLWYRDTVEEVMIARCATRLDLAAGAVPFGKPGAGELQRALEMEPGETL